MLVPSEYEGYGLIIVEALAAHVPVLAHDVGAAREAGAVVIEGSSFSDGVVAWLSGDRKPAVLQNYPYASQGAYVHAYVEDIRACISSS